MENFNEIVLEYKRNLEPMLTRIAELELELASIPCACAKQRQLRRRLSILNHMVASDRRIIYELEHYCDG